MGARLKGKDGTKALIEKTMALQVKLTVCVNDLDPAAEKRIYLTRSIGKGKGGGNQSDG